MVYPDVEFVGAKAAGVLDHDAAQDDLCQNTGQPFDDWRDVVDRRPPDSPLISSDEQFTPCAPQRREIAFEGVLRVNGYVAGVLRSSTGHLIVDAAGTVDADIIAPQVTIHGCVRGDIRATQRVALTGSAKVIGEIETLNLAIEPGAMFEGRCVFLPRSEATSSLIAGDSSDADAPNR